MNDGDQRRVAVIGQRALLMQAAALMASGRLRSGPTIEILDMTTSYRAKITYPDGREVTIGDQPTRRMMQAEAEEWVRRYGG